MKRHSFAKPPLSALDTPASDCVVAQVLKFALRPPAAVTAAFAVVSAKLAAKILGKILKLVVNAGVPRGVG